MNFLFQKPLGVKVAFVWAGILLIVLKLSQAIFPNYWSFFAPAFLLYLPVFVLMKAKEPIDFIDPTWRVFFKNFLIFLLTVVIVFPPYLLLAHIWMIFVAGFKNFHAAPIFELFRFGFYQTLVVALPEEFFFRGFLHPILNRSFKPRWHFWGVNLSWGWVLAALIFAFAHSLIHVRWWHFSIFFPALLFGFLRERTRSITAPVLFHAFSNCFMNWFAQSYFK